MRKISVNDKRTLDAEFTGQLLKIARVKSELVKYANTFVKLFDEDGYLLFHDPERGGGIKINQLSELVVKGGLGLEMLKAIDARRAPTRLEWGTYTGDCDLNLLIRRDRYPRGWMTGQVLAAVAQRVKVLLVKAIDATRYSTFVQDLGTNVADPLFRCDKLEAAARLILFVADPSMLTGDANLRTVGGVLKLFTSLVPALVERAGPDMQKVFDSLLKSSGDDFLVYQKDGLFFVTNLQYVRSSWADVDYSFFPYAPGRMDSLGFEASELAQQQRRARQVEREDLPYDVFKVTNTAFQFTQSEITNDPVDPRHDRLYTADDVGINLNATNQKQSPYNLSMYANNLIDDFDLIRTALLFPGFAVVRSDGAPPAVTRGSAKCEFVDVAIPRIGAPEWFYLQDRDYFVSLQVQGGTNSTLKIANWSYQAEENLNLMIEASVGQSHSEHKLLKRVDRLCEAWWKCELQILPPRNYDVPAFLVENYARDYAGLCGLARLGDGEAGLVNDNLGRVSKALTRYRGSDEKLEAVKLVRRATGILGRTGLCSILTGAEINEAPFVSEVRAATSRGAIKVNWSMATYLLIKAGAVNDEVWFPRDMLSLQILDEAKLGDLPAALGVGGELKKDLILLVGLVPRFEGDRNPSTYVRPAGSIAVNIDTARIRYEGELTLATQRLINELRDLLAGANNQLLRIAYGQILSTLSRVAADSYMRNVVPTDG